MQVRRWKRANNLVQAAYARDGEERLNPSPDTCRSLGSSTAWEVSSAEALTDRLS